MKDGENSPRYRGPLRLSYSTFGPYAYLEPDGSIGGSDPETWRIIAKKLGMGLEFVPAVRMGMPVVQMVHKSLGITC